MTKATPEIEALAAERLAKEEARITGQAGPGRRSGVTLGESWREFWKHPSPPMIGTFLVGSVVARIWVGGGSRWELAIPFGLLALLPVIEWCIHVGILHWKPRRLGPLKIDSTLAREHRAHHADPRSIPLVFIPWRVLLWLLPSYLLYLLVMPTLSSGLTLLVSIYGIKFGYEWTHYLMHTDYKPKTKWYRKTWRAHRLHHYKNEHYWFTVTTSGTADRLFGTYPDPSTVTSSKTVKALHAADA